MALLDQKKDDEAFAAHYQAHSTENKFGESIAELQAFEALKKKAHCDLRKESVSPTVADHELIKAELADFTKYKSTCKKACADNLDRLNLLWAFKSIFSVPWLLAYDSLLV